MQYHKFGQTEFGSDGEEETCSGRGADMRRWTPLSAIRPAGGISYIWKERATPTSCDVPRRGARNELIHRARTSHDLSRQRACPPLTISTTALSFHTSGSTLPTSRRLALRPSSSFVNISESSLPTCSRSSLPTQHQNKDLSYQQYEIEGSNMRSRILRNCLL